MGQKSQVGRAPRPQPSHPHASRPESLRTFSARESPPAIDHSEPSRHHAAPGGAKAWEDRTSPFGVQQLVATWNIERELEHERTQHACAV